MTPRATYIIMEITYYRRLWTVLNCRGAGEMAGYFDWGNIFVGPPVAFLRAL